MHFGVTPKKQQELESRMQACGLSESDIRETFVRASGPGGQHVNKTSTAVVLKHIPTGLETKCGRTRSQLLNRFYARRQMCELLEAKQQGISPFRSGTQERIRKQKDRRRRRQEKNPAAQ